MGRALPMVSPESRPVARPLAPRTQALADDLSQRLGQALASGELELPPMRQSVASLLELCNRPDFDMHEAVDVVHTDPALAGHILRLANSAALGARQRIDSITEAVGRLGARQLQAVAAGLMLKADLFRGSVRLGTRLRRMWTHSSLAGVYARDLGQMSGVEPRSAMLIGLMHDVGKPFVLRQLVQLEEDGVLTLEDDVLDDLVAALHSVLGAGMVRAWGLPDVLAAAAEFHHHPESAGEHHKAALLAAVANEFAHFAEDPSATRGAALLGNPALETLGLSNTQLGQLFCSHEDYRRSAQAL